MDFILRSRTQWSRLFRIFYRSYLSFRTLFEYL